MRESQWSEIREKNIGKVRLSFFFAKREFSPQVSGKTAENKDDNVGKWDWIDA
jgi:hypothetical protein